MPSLSCSICSKPGHSASSCKELSEPARNTGFFGGGGAHRSHGDDDEDESLKSAAVAPLRSPCNRILFEEKVKSE